MKIIIFGTGEIYRKHIEDILDTEEIIAFLDNNKKLWHEKINGITVHNPRDITDFKYDKIILMSNYFIEMREQLLELGCKEEKIIRYVEYINEKNKGEMKVIFPWKGVDFAKKKCLIITTELNYNGGSLAAIYAALALQKNGYETTVATPGGDEVFVNEMKKKRISFVIYKNLAHAQLEELYWINNFQYIIVNTLQMICCALEIGKQRNVFLWLHEPLEVYPIMQYWKENIENGIKENKLKIFAVSSIARENFLNNYSFPLIKILPYGIPDEFLPCTISQNKKIVFATVGSIMKRKGYDILIDAIEKLESNKSEQAEFLFIGTSVDNEYGNWIEERVKSIKNIHRINKGTRKEMMQYYQQIDVLIIPSREETMSIVATEAMMLGKVCIISNTSGMADYVENYSNGLIFSSGNSDELSEKIQWCINNPELLKEMGKSARTVYEKNFSMNVFAKNLEKVISDE